MINFFDSNFWATSNFFSEEEKRISFMKISEILSNNNISNLIITNKLSLNYDWDVGNNELLSNKDLIENDKFFLCFVLTPDVHFKYNFDDYILNAFKHKVRLFRFFPKSHLFYLNDFYMCKIFKKLSDISFPIMLDFKELDITGNKYFAINDLERLLRKNKKIPLILETTLKQCMFNRFYYPLLEKFENIYLEISGMLLMDQIENFVLKFGSKRLIFGTNYPSNPLELSINRMLLSELSEEVKKDISYNNIYKIIKGIEIE